MFGRIFRNRLAGTGVLIASIFVVALLICIVAGLFVKSWPLLQSYPLKNLLFGTDWKPMGKKFGFLPFILSTVYVTVIATVIAVPLCLLASIYLTEYANKKILKFITPVIDILAGIPSVIYGIWGVLVIVPLISDYIAPAFGAATMGYSILAGGIVLSIMVFPVIIHILLEVLQTVPKELKDASLSLGTTRWETVKNVVLKKAKPGIIAAVVLGFSRAFGETIAVLMVVGNIPQIPHSIFDAGYPIPALIANNYGEMMSIPSYDSALMFAALLLLIIILFFNFISRLILIRVERRLN